MNILFIDGSPNENSAVLSTQLANMTAILKRAGHSVETIGLADRTITHCVGCWNCWLKTPGRCFVQDDSHDICRAIIHADWVVFASPVRMGFTSAALKRMQDKMIPLLHPYIEVIQGECHHRKRYGAYPKLGLLLQRSRDTDREDLDIIEQIYQRFALNFRSRLYFMKTTDDPIEEVCHALDTL